MASRAPFFVAVIMPSLIGGAVAYYHGKFDLLLFLVVCAGMVLAHAGTNIINDYFDFQSGADIGNRNRTPFSGGSPFLPDGTLRPKSVLAAGLLCFAFGGLVAVFLAWRAGWPVLVLAGAGAFIGYFYTAPPLRLGYRGVGEFATGLAMGPLTVAGVYYVLTGTFALEPVVASLPIGILVATILYVNEVPDYEADRRAGKRHLVVRLGKERAVRLIPALFALNYAAVVIGVVLRIMPAWTLISLATLPVALNIVAVASSNYDDTPKYIPAQARTILVHSATGILITAGYLLASFFR
jgi:1,4-dihydroxy-2-naphthoate octaprenyltransferase